VESLSVVPTRRRSDVTWPPIFSMKSPTLSPSEPPRPRPPTPPAPPPPNSASEEMAPDEPN
jgi:hypothetical protein